MVAPVHSLVEVTDVSCNEALGEIIEVVGGVLAWTLNYHYVILVERNLCYFLVVVKPVAQTSEVNKRMTTLVL